MEFRRRKLPFSSSKRWDFQRDLIGSFLGPELEVDQTSLVGESPIRDVAVVWRHLSLKSKQAPGLLVKRYDPKMAI